jgi:mRNA-degrading endonuclease toxin of MazEF toxin-antitoxin module
MPAQGDIVWATIRDPRGKNPKQRRAVVITATEDITDEVDLAAISTKFDPNHVPPHWIEIPWHPNGHPRTSLNRPSVVKCDWLSTMRCEEVLKAGHLPNRHLLRVIQALANLNAS